jgi:hypothetical protein
MAANSATSVVDLDFNTIKSDLKTFLKGQSNIRDYDFEGSNINTLIDVLSYNTYKNNFYTNMLANEMFLDTAELRDSVVSHAKELNYVPQSYHSAKAVIDIKINPTSNVTSISVPKWSAFTSTINGATKTFSTQDDVIIKPSTNSTGSTVYETTSVPIYEGKIIDEVTQITSSAVNTHVVSISNKEVDTRHITVTVRESNTSSVNAVWSKADTVFGLTASSNVYFIEPAQNEKFNITFGDGVLGKKPAVGNLIEVKYRQSSGNTGNNGKIFTSGKAISGHSNVVATTVTNSIGGTEAETIAQIKFNAPKAFQVQERAVTANDYKILVQKEFPSVVNVLAFGGEQMSPPEFGKVIIAVDLADADGVPQSTKRAIQNYLSSRTPISIDVKVVTPEILNLEIEGKVNYNISVTTQTVAGIKSKATNALASFANANINAFDVTYRNSKAVATIDACDTSVVSSQLTTRLYKKFTPSATLAASYVIAYNNELQNDEEFISATTKYSLYKPAISSTQFTYLQDSAAFIVDDGRGKLQIVKTDSADNFVVLLADAGTVDYTTGLVNINSLLISAYSGTTFKVYARCVNRDITTKKASILQLDASDISITAVQERL